MREVRYRGITESIRQSYAAAMGRPPSVDAPVEVVTPTLGVSVGTAAVVIVDDVTPNRPGHAVVDGADADAVALATALAAKGYAVRAASRKIVSMPLSDDDRRLLAALVEGASIATAADAVGYSSSQFRRHLRRIEQALGARNHYHAVAIAAELGLLE